MMYGTVETDEERIEHLLRLRELQDETGGFTAFITWSYQPDHTELAGSEATGIDYLRTLALSRIVLDNFPSLQASWVTQGGKVGQLSLAYGANDMGSVMIEENVVRAAGASYCMDEVEIVRNIEDAGFAAKRRNMHYEVLGDPIFREREVPRMLELATAREDGDDSVPAELMNYPARSRSRQAAPRRPVVIRYRAAWVLPVGGPPDPRRLGRGGSQGRIVALGRRIPWTARCRARSRLGGAPSRTRQRAHTPRAVVFARRRCRLPPRSSPGFAASWLHGASGRIPSRRKSSRHRAAASTKRSRSGTALVGDISNTLVTRRAVGAAVRLRRSCSTN